jgi:hypothetical protein
MISEMYNCDAETRQSVLEERLESLFAATGEYLIVLAFVS